MSHESVIAEIRARAERAPASEALIAGARRVTYAELVARMDRHAAALHAAGVRAGERVGLAAAQGTGFVEAALGILAADACLVPIADAHSGAALDAFAERARLAWLCVESATGELRTSPCAASACEHEAEFRALRPAYLRFTSGTTSRRKGVILGHAALQARLTAANRGLGIGPEDRIVWLLPMAHHFVVSILLYLRNGAAILLPQASLAKPILELAARERATVFYASPYHMNLLAKDASGLGLAAVRLAISTAEGLRVEIARAFLARFGFPLAQALGIIECGLPVLNTVSAAAKPTSLGRPLPDYEVWLRGDDGAPLAGPTSPEKTGEICIRGPGLFDAYLEPWTPAREVLTPDGFRTGDQGYFDVDGDLFLVGRRANRINLAGMKFFAEEVEAVLDAHPRVRRSRVFGREHAQLGEIPVAELEPAEPAEPPSHAELIAWLRERLPSYKIPRVFQLVESLPETVTGKLARPSGSRE